MSKRGFLPRLQTLVSVCKFCCDEAILTCLTAHQRPRGLDTQPVDVTSTVCSFVPSKFLTKSRLNDVPE